MGSPVPRTSVCRAVAHERQAQAAEHRDSSADMSCPAPNGTRESNLGEDPSRERAALEASSTATSSTSITELRPNDPPMVNPLTGNRVRRAGPHLLGSWDLRLRHSYNALSQIRMPTCSAASRDTRRGFSTSAVGPALVAVTQWHSAMEPRERKDHLSASPCLSGIRPAA